MSATDGGVSRDRIREAHLWLAVAEEDIRAAELCVGVADPVVSVSAFHCQQAAEKILKGLLVAASIPFRKTHDMDELADLAVLAYPELAPLFDGMRRLTLWSVAFRYPSLEEAAEPVPDVQEVQATLQAIGRLAEALRHRVAPNG